MGSAPRQDGSPSSTRRNFLTRCTCAGLYLTLFGGTKVAAQGWPKDTAKPSGTGSDTLGGWPKGGSAASNPATEPSRSLGQSRGCSLSVDDVGFLKSGEMELLHSCGIRRMDVLMRQEADILCEFLRVNPGFYFLDDSASSNAYATDESMTRDTRGTVLFGVGLFRDEAMKNPLSGNALIGILAHEHAHILEYDSEFHAATVTMELLADFMAGWFLGQKAVRGVPGLDIRVLAASLFEKGGYDFNNPNFHGTPEQRVQAMLVGFQHSLNGVADSGQAFRMGQRLIG